jgi:adenylate kinase
MKRLVIMGPPASGKGTQGRRLAAMLGVPHVSSGHLLRRSMDRGDPYGVRPMVSAGIKVPDEVVEGLLIPALGPGFVLDGYPRTRRQAERLDHLLDDLGRPLDAVLELALDEEALMSRMARRAGAEKRSDDRPDVFLRRLEDYRAESAGIREHYGSRLIQVDGSGDPDEVFRQLRSTLGLAAA